MSLTDPTRPGLRPLAEGESVWLKSRGSAGRLVRLAKEPQRVGDDSIVDLTSQIGQLPGGRVRWAGEDWVVLRPWLKDLYTSLRRTAQIVLPKDALALIFRTGVGPGSTVIEAGTGSGALTLALAHAVGDEGKVFSYDRRREFQDPAREGLDRAGVSGRVVLRIADVAQSGFEETGVDAVILDLAEPWNLVAAATRALAPGGGFGAYVPTFNQLEQVALALELAQFVDVESVELLERRLKVSPGATRPEFDMLGHTGFLSAARWLG